MKFAITGLPRSKTKWASVFLSTPDCPVKHDAHPDDFDLYQAVSTSLVISHFRLLSEDTKIAYIDRCFADVFDSSEIYGMGGSAAELEMYKAAMFKERDVKVFDFYNLDAAELWEFCHGTQVTDEYIKVFDDMNITQQKMDTLRRAA